jgi:hypothetical protein
VVLLVVESVEVALISVRALVLTVYFYQQIIKELSLLGPKTRSLFVPLYSIELETSFGLF